MCRTLEYYASVFNFKIKYQILFKGTDKMDNKTIIDKLKALPPFGRMPVLFVGHGSPMNAIEDNSFSRSWQELGRNLPIPKAILSVSAHWLTNGAVKVTGMDTPRTIHDFYGFPQALYNVRYPAPGAVDYADATAGMVHMSNIKKDMEWGLDHGTWSVLSRMFPKADIPVYQLSIDITAAPQYHYELAEELMPLRDKGVLVMGSGNIVHNLRAMNPDSEPYDWAVEFDEKIAEFVDKRDFMSVVNYEKLGNISALAHPTNDHYLPLLYSLALTNKNAALEWFNTGFDLASISMRSFASF